MHEPPDISEDDLRTCLQDQYDLGGISLEFLPNGLNINAGVYRVMCLQGTPYLLKVKSTSLYEPSCLVPRYLRDHGIAFVVAPLPTRMNALWTQVKDWSVSLYPFIDGESGWNPPMTDDQWRVTGTVLHHIHQTSLPPEGFASLRREAFDPTEYRRWINDFESQHVWSKGKSPAEQELHAVWKAHEDTIHTAMTTMEMLAGSLHDQVESYVICHADIHPSNLIRDPQGRVYVIDWDDVMLAPKERDFLFVADSPVDADGNTAPFFHGYGETAINWRALTYYRWERVVQDLIEYASDVCFRDHLAVAAKIESVGHFSSNLKEGMMINAAQDAADHLSSELRFPRGG
jgi:spectinomycin phosphotransferase